MAKSKIAIFEGKKIRRIWDDNKEKWYFSVVDVVTVLTSSSNPRKYWNKLAQRLREEGSESVTNCHQLKMLATDGKYYQTDAADTEVMLRIIQSIPSPKAEPFKRWLAKVGYDRLQEIEDPELTNYTLSFSVSLSFTRLSFPSPICHSRPASKCGINSSGNPVEGKLQWELSSIYA